MGITPEQFSGQLSKDILSSGKFLEEVLIPAAMAQGKIEELIASFSHFETGLGYVRSIRTATRSCRVRGLYSVQRRMG